MKLVKLAGATSEIFQVFIQDSSSTTGAALTGLAYNSSSLTAYYHRDTDTTATAISLVTMTVGTFTSSGFKEIDATNMPGWYQFCPPNAALASGAKSCAFHLKGATNMAPLPIECQLTAVNVDDAVRMGMTALPNAAAEASGGLYTRGTGAGQIQQEDNGQVSINVKAWLRTTVSTPTNAGVPNVNAKTWNDLATVALPLIPTTAGRTLDVSATGEAGVDWANVGSPTTTVDLSNTTIKTTQKVDVDTIKTNPVVNGGTITFPTTATLASTTNLTAGTIATVSGNVNGSVGSVTGAVGSVTGNVGGNVTGSVGSLAAQAQTDVKTQAVAALNTDTYAEPGQGTPAATTTLVAKLGWLYKAFRNKTTQTASQYSLYNDDAVTVDAKASVSDDGTTTTKGEIATGP